MKSIRTELEGVLLFEPTVHRDARGYFLETYTRRAFEAASIGDIFVQDNRSYSTRGTLRGLHAQLTKPQSKLVQCVEGEIFDVAVDIRRGSATFGRWTGAMLSGENFKQMYIPRGFLHGFCVRSETAIVEYKCSDYYAPEDEVTVMWSDPDIGIRWPVEKPVLSQKDAAGVKLSVLKDRLAKKNESRV